jgi:hypothetical protein
VEACAHLQATLTELNVHVCDVSKKFADIYEHPQNYHFSEEKKHEAYTTSKDFNMHDHVSSAPGYLFWDTIHPTATCHHLLGQFILGDIENRYDLQAPSPSKKTDAQNMFEKFMYEYHKKLSADKSSTWHLWGTITYDNLLKELTATGSIEDLGDYPRLLEKILKHGTHKNGERTRKILLELQWINYNNEVDTSNPALAVAKRMLDLDLQSSKPTA